MQDNTKLRIARNRKDDEFYTPLSDVKFGCEHLLPFLKNRVVWLPCDTTDSMYFKYLVDKVDILILSSCHKWEISLYKKGVKFATYPTQGPAGFECKQVHMILQRYSAKPVVITNPPFSKCRDFYKMLKKYDYDFSFIGNFLSVIGVDFLPDIVSQKLFISNERNGKFMRPDGSIKGITYCYFTNLNYWWAPQRDPDFGGQTYPNYHNGEYRVIDGYLEVSKMKYIPTNYYDWIIVPFSTGTGTNLFKNKNWEVRDKSYKAKYLGKNLFAKLLIRKRRPEEFN